MALAARQRTATNSDPVRAGLRSTGRLKTARAWQVAGRQPLGDRACLPCRVLVAMTPSGASFSHLGMQPYQGSRRYFRFML